MSEFELAVLAQLERLVFLARGVAFGLGFLGGAVLFRTMIAALRRKWVIGVMVMAAVGGVGGAYADGQVCWCVRDLAWCDTDGDGWDDADESMYGSDAQDYHSQPPAGWTCETECGPEGEGESEGEGEGEEGEGEGEEGEGEGETEQDCWRLMESHYGEAYNPGLPENRDNDFDEDGVADCVELGMKTDPCNPCSGFGQDWDPPIYCESFWNGTVNVGAAAFMGEKVYASEDESIRLYGDISGTVTLNNENSDGGNYELYETNVDDDSEVNWTFGPSGARDDADCMAWIVDYCGDFQYWTGAVWNEEYQRVDHIFGGDDGYGITVERAVRLRRLVQMYDPEGTHDSDGDGVSDYAELVEFGTDPCDGPTAGLSGRVPGEMTGTGSVMGEMIENLEGRLQDGIGGETAAAGVGQFRNVITEASDSMEDIHRSAGFIASPEGEGYWQTVQSWLPVDGWDDSLVFDFTFPIPGMSPIYTGFGIRPDANPYMPPAAADAVEAFRMLTRILMQVIMTARLIVACYRTMARTV